MNPPALLARLSRSRRLRPGLALRACVVALPPALLCAAAAPADAARDYRAVVQRFAATLIEKGADRYGPVHSPMFAATLDLKTLSIPPAPPKLPEGPRIREGDRCTNGSNPYLDTQTIRAFGELSRLTGDPKYRQATERYLAYFLEHCPSPSTGLLPWGEHVYWNFITDRPERDAHEFLVWLPLWAEMWEIRPEVVARAIRAAYSHHVLDKKTGIFDRHASYASASAVLGKREGMAWIKHAGLQAYSLLFLHAHTGDALALERARQMARLYWDRRDPKTNLPIGCIKHAEEPGSGGIAQTEALLAAYQVSGLVGFRDMALTYLRAGAATLPHDGTAARKLEWAIGYGSDGGAFREAQYYLNGLALAGETSLRPACEYYARCIAASLPPAPYATPEAYGRAIQFLCGLAVCTGNAEHRALAEKLAEHAMEKLWDSRSGLFRGMEGYDCYEAQLGTGDLLLGLLALSQKEYRLPPLAARPTKPAASPAEPHALARLSVEPSPRMVPAGIQSPLTLRLRGYAGAPLTLAAKLTLPEGWKAECPAQMVAPAGKPHPDDPWLVSPGVASERILITAPKVAAEATETLTLELQAGKEASRRVAILVTAVPPQTVVSAPLKADADTLLLARFEGGPGADFAAPGVTWMAEGVEMADRGASGRSAAFAKEAARARVAFEKGVPKAGTIEFFARPRWSTVAGPAPGSDGVLRHTFWWAPLAGSGMLTCYYLDEYDYFGARCVRPGAKEAISLPMDVRQGEWHHVAFCWETPEGGGLKGTLFIDGVPTTTGVSTWPAPMAFLKEITFGAMESGNTWPNADIDEVRISAVPRYRGTFLVRLP